MNKNEFEQFESVKFWMSSLHGKEGIGTTKYHWKIQVRKFCNWIGKTPDELIEERKEDLTSKDERMKHRAEMKVKEFLRFLENERELAPNTIRAYFEAIRSFYSRNYCELKFFRHDAPRSEIVTKGTRCANKEDIQKMIELAKPRDRALILFIKDSGLSESDVAKLKLSNLEVESVSEVFSKKAPMAIVTKRKKTRVPIITFVGKEGLDALRATLRIRMQGSPELKIRRYGRYEIKGGLPPEELTLESPLFRSYGKFMRTLKKKKPEVHHLTPHAISVIVRKCAIRAGIWQEGFSAHALRRFFQTNLESAGINANWIKRMMGHKLSGSEQPYSQPEINMLREAYNKAYAHLAITEVAVQQSRVETLEAQVEKLLLNGKHKEEQIKTLQASQSQAKIEALTKQVEEQNKQIMELMRTVAKLAMKAKPISKEELEAEEMQAEN